ncbi:STAS domain-containing protein [Nannocystis punicea]|uniref:STAS domain-containing protein n=1 Tax=Nannocystis punicea TaxID=2995304 RepID=UPI0023E10F8D|nr:STAS domain-containing protein [Nannocystis poenicansa]
MSEQGELSLSLARAEEELLQLRQRLAQVEGEARRYRALVDSSAVSIQVYRPDGSSAEVNGAYEQLWRVTAAQVAEYNVLQDPQIRAFGIMPLVERVFHEGVSSQMPSVRYDPCVNELVSAGQAAWVASAMSPVLSAEGTVEEVLQIHLHVGELKQSEEELREQNRRLEEAVQARTAELEAKLQLIESQQEVIRELSTPIIEVWDGVITLPIVGLIDSVRTAEIMDSLLQAVARTRARFAILDLTGVEVVDTGTASHLIGMIQAIRLLGAEGILTGIHPVIAQTVVALGVDLTRVTVHAKLRDALQYCLTRLAERRAWR